MAVTITQQPTSPGAAYSKLIYCVTSTNSSNPQFSYVCDIYESGSSELINRVTQVPNASNAGVFSIEKIIQGTLEYGDYQKQQYGAGTITTGLYFTSSVGSDFTSSKTYILQFGEAYGTSISSSVNYYTNLTETSGSFFTGVWDANNPEDSLLTYINWKGIPTPDTLNYNFPSSSKLQPPNSDLAQTRLRTTLTDNPYVAGGNSLAEYDYDYPGRNFVVVNQNDYHTISYFTQEETNGWNPFEYGIFAYNVGLPSTSMLITPAEASLKNNHFIHMGVGPANITDFANSGKTGSNNDAVQLIASGDWTHYNFRTYLGNYAASSAAHIDTIFLNEKYAQDPQFVKTLYFPQEVNSFARSYCTERLRFTFINRYGVWDYYTNYNPVRRSTNLTKENVSLPKVDYSGATSTYDYTTRGEVNYFTDFNDRYVVDTPLLDKPIANWLEQLIDSPSVYVQQGDDFVPIVITNSSYTANTDQSRQKLFQYTIEFEYAKNR